MDAFLHMHCKEPEAIGEKLKWYDQQLQEVFRVARERDPEASLMVCSDHGMTPVTRHADLVGGGDKTRLADATGLSRGVRLDHGTLLVLRSGGATASAGSHGVSGLRTHSDKTGIARSSG